MTDATTTAALPGDGAWLLSQPKKGKRRGRRHRRKKANDFNPSQLLVDNSFNESIKEPSGSNAIAPASFPSPRKPASPTPHSGKDNLTLDSILQEKRDYNTMPPNYSSALAPHERAKLKSTAREKHQKADGDPSNPVSQPRLVPYSESSTSDGIGPAHYPSPPATAVMRHRGRGRGLQQNPSPRRAEHAERDINDGEPASGWAAKPLESQQDTSWTPALTPQLWSKGGTGRGSGTQRGAKPSRSRWPDKKDIPKGDPKRHEITWSSGSQRETDLDSNRASSGWGTRKKRGGVEGAAPLADWGGGWAPPPIDWDSRPGFVDDSAIERVQNWLAQVDKAFESIKQPDLSQAIGGFSFNAPDVEKDKLDQHLQGDAAPRYWIPYTVGNQTGKLFWQELVKSKSPKPVDEEDCEDSSPWWELYQSSNDCHFLKHYQQPSIEGFDPDETQAERIARANDNGSLTVVENKRATEKAKREAHLQRQRLIQDRVKRIMKSKGSDSRPSNRLKPDVAKFFLRGATAEDMPQVRDIYNAYIDRTVVVPETTHRGEHDMERRRRNIKLSSLHFIVACERGQVIKGRKSKKTEDIVLADKILGFAYVDDWHDMQGIYRFSMDLEVYVHHDYYGRSIGSCLLDKMLALLDPCYLERGGYETHGEELDGVGPSRVCKEIVIHYPYDSGNKDKVRWVGAWLESWPGFRKVGKLEGIGYKFDLKLNLAIFQRSTGAQIDPSKPPVTMQYPRY